MKKRLFFLLSQLCCSVLILGQTKVTVLVDQPTKLIADAGDDVSIREGESVVLGNTDFVSGGTPGYIYSWINNSIVFSTEEHPSVTPNETTYYKIIITDTLNCMATDSIMISITYTQINDISEKEYKIYPNPTNDLIYIEAPNNSIITLFDPDGKVLLTKILYGKECISIPSRSGLYLLEILNGNKKIVKKIIVN